MAYKSENDSGVGLDDNPNQVILVLIVMLIQFLYLALVRPLASPLAMTIEITSAACECMVTLMAYWLIDDPSAEDRYGPVMNALVMLSIGLQIVAQFGSMIDETIAYAAFVYEFFGPCFEAIGAFLGCCASEEDLEDALDEEEASGDALRSASVRVGETMSTKTGATLTAGLASGCALMCFSAKKQEKKGEKKKDENEGPESKDEDGGFDGVVTDGGASKGARWNRLDNLNVSDEDDVDDEEEEGFVHRQDRYRGGLRPSKAPRPAPRPAPALVVAPTKQPTADSRPTARGPGNKPRRIVTGNMSDEEEEEEEKKEEEMTNKNVEEEGTRRGVVVPTGARRTAGTDADPRTDAASGTAAAAVRVVAAASEGNEKKNTKKTPTKMDSVDDLSYLQRPERSKAKGTRGGRRNAKPRDDGV